MKSNPYMPDLMRCARCGDKLTQAGGLFCEPCRADYERETRAVMEVRAAKRRAATMVCRAVRP